MKITPEQIKKIKESLPYMQEDEKRVTLELLKEYDNNSVQIVGKDSLLEFANHVYPGYIVGPHHRRLAKLRARCFRVAIRRVQARGACSAPTR